MNKLSDFINVPTPDAEDARRRRLLSIMLLGVATGTLLALVVLLIVAPMGLAGEQEEVRALGFGIALTLFGVAVTYALNRYVSSELAGTLFVLLLIAMAALSDEPREVVNGRGLLVFTIPILAASVLLRPWASFVAAGLSGLTIIAVGLGVPGHFPNVPAILAFFVLASVSWLSARSLERTLEDARISSEALWASEEQYRQLIETMQEGVWTIDQDAYTTFVNPRMAEMLGYSVDEMQGKHLFSFMDESGVEIAKRNLERRQQGIKEEHDFEFVRKDGARIYALVATLPLTDTDGNYIGAIAGVQDITERKRAEDALQQRTAQVRLLFEAGQRLGQSLELEAIFATVHEVISQTMTCNGLVVSSYSQQDNLIRCVALYDEGTPLDVSEFPPIPLEPEGKGTQSVAIRTGESLILADYQKQLQTAQTAYHMDKEKTVAYDKVPADDEITRSALVVPLKSEGRVIGVVQVFSYRVDDFTEDDLNLLEVLAPQIATAMTNALLYQQAQREVDERKRAEAELREHRENLEELVAQRTTELNERVAEVEQLNRGMTNLLEDLQAAHHNVEATATKLQEVNQELEDFAYVVSHDLKAPLRAITQLAGWISTDYADALDAEGQEMLDLLMARTRHMHDLIDGILQYSRVGRLTEEVSSVNLDQLVQETVEMLAPPEHVHIAVKDGLPTVLGERTRLGQVFQNLLSNAVKFMDKPEGQVSIGCVDEGTHWRFSVADNGPGIEEKHYPKVFQMFQTLAPRDQVESTGIGLALVKKIVETWSGRIWLESTVGEGSTFYFTLPKVSVQGTSLRGTK
jgi:PAS domain S-box-containing protein